MVFLLPVSPLEGKNRDIREGMDPAPVCAPSMWNARAVSRIAAGNQGKSHCRVHARRTNAGRSQNVSSMISTASSQDD
jgi:hypothetical protein